MKQSHDLNPRRAVLHPAWIVAVVVLIVNDHVLKPAAFAEPLAGKLSDFAGLLFAPVLLAALLKVKTERGVWACGVAVGAVFAAINVSPELAVLWDGLVSIVVPFHTTTDPTDLVALVSIPAGIALFLPHMKERTGPTRRRALELAAVTVAGMASMATSPPCDDEFCGGAPGTFEDAQVSLLNKSNELHVLRARRLRDRVRIDCDEVASDPNGHLKSGVFGPPETWFVQSGQEIPLRSVAFNDWGEPVEGSLDRDCHAVLVESDTVQDILVFWNGDLPVKSFAFDADVPQNIPADEQTVVLDADYSRTPEDQMHEWRERGDCGERADLCDPALLEPLAEIPDGARYSWRSSHSEQLHFVRPTLSSGTLDQVDEQCVVPGPSQGVAWERPPVGEFEIDALMMGRDGCHEFLLTDTVFEMTPEPMSWWLCAPIDALPFLDSAAPVRVAISRISSAATFARGGYDGIRIDMTRQATEDGGSSEFRRVFVVRGYGVPEEIDYEYRAVPRESCAPQEVGCGQVAVPVDIEIDGYEGVVAPGETAELGGTVFDTQVHVVRAEYRPVLDTNCEADAVGSGDQTPANPSEDVHYMEAVVVTN